MAISTRSGEEIVRSFLDSKDPFYHHGSGYYPPRRLMRSVTIGGSFRRRYRYAGGEPTANEQSQWVEGKVAYDYRHLDAHKEALELIEHLRNFRVIGDPRLSSD